jgi:subtilisin family serine protease
MFSSFTYSAGTGSPGKKQPDAARELPVQPIIRHVDAIDRDFDGIQDSLETRISQGDMNGSAVLPVVVTLYSPVVKQDLDYFMKLGGRVTHVYRYVTYGFAGVIPAVNITAFANLEGGKLAIIEYDAAIRCHLDVSVPLIRARPIVWNSYGYMGSPNHSIAIIDTGIDDSHPDVGPYGDLNFSRKIVGWYDATPDGSPTPEDYGEHGTHVAGIAAGTGMANSLQGPGSIETTFTYVLPSAGWGYMDNIDVMNPGVIELNCSWDGSNEVLLGLYNPAGERVASTGGRIQPLILTYNTTNTSYPTGRYGVLVANLAGPSDTPFSCREKYPYQGLNDGYNLITGVAPNSKLVGVKVFDNTGSGTMSTVMAGMDWVIENRMKYNIVVASMSIGLEDGATDTTLDHKADTMVQYGIVTVVSAGNDFPNYTIGSPGTAAYVITVAATNDQNGITSYSSNGDPSKNEYGLIKPDIAAPGGTFYAEFGNRIVSADSNDVDAGYTGYLDRNADDYQQMAGTSMSTPHVSGLSALIIQALSRWNWTLEEALKVKMIISMTAFETQRGEKSNDPPLNRGGKDSVEGYGRVSVDAAIEAVTMSHIPGEAANGTLGPGPSDKKVWARKVSLSTGATYRFNLSVPEGADYDLYLYDGNPDEYGQPVVLVKSVNASEGGVESFQYAPSYSGTHFIVVKWVSGSGLFNLESTVKRHDVAVNIKVSPLAAPSGQPIDINVTVENLGDFPEFFNVTVYADRNIGDLHIDIGNETVFLDVGNSTVLEFVWNTTDVPYGTYWITAEALLQEDNNLTNNIDRAMVGGIHAPSNNPQKNLFAPFATLVLVIVVVAVLGTLAILFFRLLMSTRPRLSLWFRWCAQDTG